jgi:hypothetical protein
MHIMRLCLLLIVGQGSQKDTLCTAQSLKIVYVGWLPRDATFVRLEPPRDASILVALLIWARPL